MTTAIPVPQGQIEVTWDYTSHARHYDKRADYSSKAIRELTSKIAGAPSKPVADIGAGTGKLTKELLACGLTVRAVEPNDAMRGIGAQNTAGKSATWTKGTGESTGLATGSVQAAFFGSSFNVLNQQLALKEVARIVEPGGSFACMWNHRDLEDPVQRAIETIIKKNIHDYGYGSRREDPSDAINASGLFGAVGKTEGNFLWKISHEDTIVAWNSHATLRRQAKSDAKFRAIVDEIAKFVKSLPDPIEVPYTTRIFFASLLRDTRQS